MSYRIDIDDLYPRDAEHRYRLYARRGRALEVLAVAGSWGGVGEAIGQLDADEVGRGRRLMDRGAFGILDAVEERWVVLPWHRPDGRVTFRPAVPRPSRWTGTVVRSRSGTGRLWQVGALGPLGYRLEPLGDDVSGIRAMSRTAKQLEERFDIVQQPKGER